MARSTVSAAREGGAQAGSSRTVAALWREAVSEPRTRPAYLVERDDGWQQVSWQETARRVDELANGMLSLGIRRGDPVAILGRTTLDWVLVDLALALVGGIGVPIYPNSSSDECRYILDHSGAVGIFVDEAVRPPALERAGKLTYVVPFDELDRLAEDGRRYAAERPGALDEASGALDENDVFTYQYTSGTTGPPKACVVQHRSYVEMTRAAARLPGLIEGEEVVLLFLPLAHNFGRLLHLAGVHVGFTTALLSDPLRVRDVLAEVRPTLLPSVPRLYEKMQAAVQEQFAEARGVRRRLVAWALDVGYRASPYKQRGAALPPALALQHRVAHRIVYSRVKERLGGRLRAAISGGAPLAKEVGEFFLALDIPILEGYGQSECTTACTVNLPGRIKFGTVGRPFPGFEVRTADDGEILVRGETVFAGYLNDEEATRQTLDADGWLHTGDVGWFDPDGFLTLTDRKKDIIVTAGGKNVSPQNLESALKGIPLVSQALVVGDRRPYVAALLTLDEDEAGKWAKQRERTIDVEALSTSSELRDELQTAVDHVNDRLARFEQIKRFAVLPRDFSADEGEVTPTLKLRRRVSERHFAAEIERLYGGDSAA